LHSRTYLVGQRITLADITVAAVLQSLFTGLWGAAERAKIPNIVRHYNTIVNQTALKSIYGEVTLAEKAQKYVAPAKPAKEKVPAPPKPAVPKPKKAAEEEEEEEEESQSEEERFMDPPKRNNTIDSLPKSTLNLEDWKRAYSNLDTRGAGGSLEWFYDNYDPEGYSLWKVAFKYPEELTQTFMSSNQIGGFFCTY
jgi:elongation factor 1-gamma